MEFHWWCNCNASTVRLSNENGKGGGVMMSNLTIEYCSVFKHFMGQSGIYIAALNHLQVKVEKQSSLTPPWPFTRNILSIKIYTHPETRFKTASIGLTVLHLQINHTTKTLKTSLQSCQLSNDAKNRTQILDYWWGVAGHRGKFNTLDKLERTISCQIYYMCFCSPPHFSSILKHYIIISCGGSAYPTFVYKLESFKVSWSFTTSKSCTSTLTK